MPWPSNTDYQEAIQTPAVCFSNSELKNGTIETNRLGLPRPFSGNFACVYKVNCSGRTYAVRCFLREFADQRERYQKISEYLQLAKMPCMVGFDFIPQGIRVRGQWYPILKMEWLQGDLLHNHIKQNLNRSTTFAALANNWLELCKSLKNAHIAHGDFQHGNIIIVNNQFKLIDYDGMFVPSLANRNSHEIGHPNYQHPRRNANHFGLFLDNFSAWVIYISLVALSIDPNLWHSTGAGDECLLFRQEDFQNPDTSRAFTILESHPNIHIQTLAIMFKNLVYHDPDNIPGLDGQTAYAPCQPVNTGDWISDHISISKELLANQSTNNDASWITDWMSNEESNLEPVLYPRAIKEIRFIFYGSMSFILAMGIQFYLATEIEVLLALIYSIGILIPLNIIYLYFRHKTDPAVKARAKYKNEVQDKRQQLNSSKDKLDAQQKMLQSLREEERTKSDVVQKKIEELRLAESREVNSINAQLNRILAGFSQSKNKLVAERDSALNASRSKCQNEINRIDAAITSLDRDEKRDIDRMLLSLQNQFIDSHLRKHRLINAQIPGLTRDRIEILIDAGYNTAYDINSSIRQFRGIGPKSEERVVNWRKRLESNARSMMPSDLSPTEKGSIQTRYTQRRNQLHQEKSTWQSRLQNETASITSQANAELSNIEQNIRSEQASVEQKVRVAKQQTADHRYALERDKSNIAKDYAPRKAAIESNIKERLKDVSQMNWQLMKVNCMFTRYRQVSFATLFKRILLWR